MLSPTHFNEGDVVNIYTDYIQGKKFEGAATLIEKRCNGRSLIMHDECLLTKLEEKPITEDGHIPLTPSEISGNKKYSLLKHYLLGKVRSGVRHVNEDLHTLYKHLVNEANTRIDNPSDLLDILFRYRVKWQNVNDERKNFFTQCTNDEIIRFVYQTKYDTKWTHSIFREEEWIVEFNSPQFDVKTKECLFFGGNFRTARKLIKLVCICFFDDAQKSELILHKTNSKNISNFDKRLSRDTRRKQAEDFDEDEDYDEDEINDDDSTSDACLRNAPLRSGREQNFSFDPDDDNPSDEDLRSIENDEIFLYNDDEEIEF
jgi:hypothetical protein